MSLLINLAIVAFGCLIVVFGQSYSPIPVSSVSFNCTGKTQGFYSDVLDANYSKGYFYYCNSAGILSSAYACQSSSVTLSNGTSVMSPSYFDNTGKQCRAGLIFCPAPAASGGAGPTCPGDPICPPS